MTIVSINDISKSFGSHDVLKGISIAIEEGQIFGLLGRNGAGKTTLMKIILGLLESDKGTVQIIGENVQFGRSPANQHIGYLPDVPAFYPFMTAKEYLLLCCEITNIPKTEQLTRVQHYLSLVGLEDTAKRISGFSRGMKQRLGIAQALIHQPKILICDEPTSALDPIGRKDILHILQRIKHETTVIFSTHILHDAEQICDTVALLHDGKFVLEGHVEHILKQYERPLLHVSFQRIADAQKFESLFPDAVRKGDTFIIQTTSSNNVQEKVLNVCLEEQLTIQSLHMERSTLEDIFLEVTST